MRSSGPCTTTPTVAVHAKPVRLPPGTVVVVTGENYGGLPQPGMRGLDAGAEEWREWSTTIEKEDDMTGEPIHSGNELCENLDVLGMSAVDLCRRIEVPVSRMTELLNVRRAVTGNTALRPGRVFGT